MLSKIRYYKKKFTSKSPFFIDTMFIPYKDINIERNPFSYIEESKGFQPLATEELYYTRLDDEEYKHCAVYLSKDRDNELLYNGTLLVSVKGIPNSKLYDFTLTVQPKSEVGLHIIYNKDINLLETSAAVKQDLALHERVEATVRKHYAILHKALSLAIQANKSIHEQRSFLILQTSMDTEIIIPVDKGYGKTKVKDLKEAIYAEGYTGKIRRITKITCNRYLKRRLMLNGRI